MPRKPPRFHGFVGQKKILDHLLRLLEGAKAQGKPLPHCIFKGTSGSGKTTLAYALADEYGTTCIHANGHDNLETLCTKLRKLNACDILLIDEAHNLTPAAQELLYTAIDKREIHGWAYQGTQKPGSTPAPCIEIQPWSLILATDRAGKLRDALKKRIAVTVWLRPYTETEMREIVDRMASDEGLLMKAQGANLISKISDGNPRKARHHIQQLAMFYATGPDEALTLHDIRRYLNSAGIDADGFSPEHRHYLRKLHTFGKASIDSLAITLHEDNDSVKYEIESKLIQNGLIRFGSGGRELTPTGLAWIESNIKHQKDQH